MSKRKKSSGRDSNEVLEYLQRWRREREESLDFEELRKALKDLAVFLQIISLPTKEEQEVILVSKSVNSNLKFVSEYWWLHDYPGSREYRERVEQFNRDIETSGLPVLGTRTPLAKDSWASVAMRAIEEKRLSTAFFDAWAQLHTLSGRYIELMSLQESAKMTFERNIEAGARSATLAQHVWCARWLLKHVVNFNEDREDVEDEFVKLCGALAKGLRTSPDQTRWPPDWFRKLLQKRKGAKQFTLKDDGATLVERLHRLSEGQLQYLAEKKGISDDLLPPLEVGAFPRVSNHP